MEIDHENILWNSAFELMSIIDKYVDEMIKQKDDSHRESNSIFKPSDEIKEQVRTLQVLRHFMQQSISDCATVDKEEYEKMVKEIDGTVHAYCSLNCHWPNS